MTKVAVHKGFQFMLVAAAVAGMVFAYARAQAAPLTSPNYRLDAQVMNNFGGQSASSSYALLGSGGEAIVGNGAGGSYKLGAGFVPQTEKSLELQLAEGGLVARYSFDTGNGVVAYDVSGNDNNARFEPGANSPSWNSSGKFQGDVTFDGGDAAVAPHSASLSLSSFTISAWVKPATFPANFPNIISKENSASSRNYAVYIDSSRRVVVSSSFGGSQQDLVSSQQLSAGQYYHVAYTVGGGTRRVYINGQLSATAAYSGAVDMQSSLLRVGDRLNGALDELRIYSRAFSANEVKWQYEANQQGVVTTVAIPEVTTGQSQSTALNAIVRTDFGGYDLAIAQNGPLTNVASAATIPAINNGGSIALPVSWNEGVTSGFGFSIVGGVNVDPKWNGAYASLPSSATTFYGKSGLSGGVKESTNLEFRLDVERPQESGRYQNIVTITATARP